MLGKGKGSHSSPSPLPPPAASPKATVYAYIFCSPNPELLQAPKSNFCVPYSLEHLQEATLGLIHSEVKRSQCAQ